MVYYDWPEWHPPCNQVVHAVIAAFSNEIKEEAIVRVTERVMKKSVEQTVIELVRIFIHIHYTMSFLLAFSSTNAYTHI